MEHVLAGTINCKVDVSRFQFAPQRRTRNHECLDPVASAEGHAAGFQSPRVASDGH